MILENRTFIRREPTKEPKIIIIYCEGKKTEPNYFKYFEDLSSQIKLEIIPALHNSNNSPTGLFERAEIDLLDENTQKYQIDNKIDEVWFVIDTDKWGDKIKELRDRCRPFKNWSISQSNPCFEVWLYYHFKSEKPAFEGVESSTNWKEFLNDIIPGGFDKRKHPCKIKVAIKNSERNYSETTENTPNIATTQLFKLANSFYPIIENKL